LELKLKAEARTETGKGPARRMRAKGEIPAVLYGLGSAPCSLKVKREDIRDALHSEAGAHALIDLQVIEGKEKESHLVMIKEVQRHPFKDRILHVDFLKVARDEKITVRVPVAVSGEEESPGLKAGGTLQHNLWEIEIECLPAEIPDHLSVDVSEMNIGEHLRVADLKCPAGVTVLTDTEDTLLTVLAPRLLEKEEELELEAAAEEAEAPAEEVSAEEQEEKDAAPPEGG